MKNLTNKSHNSLLDYIKEYIPFFIFCLSSIFFAYHHELWFDELQDFLISSSSSSIFEILSKTRYEGTPPLWHIINYFCYNIFNSISYKKYLPVIFSTINFFLIYLLLNKPKNKFKLYLIGFGYFFFVEYSLMSRNYGISITFIFLSILAYKKNSTSSWIFLGLACFCNTYALLNSLFIALYYLLTKPINKNYFLVYIFFLFSSIASIIPPSDIGYGEFILNDKLYLGRIVLSIFHTLNGLFPIFGDNTSLHFINYNISKKIILVSTLIYVTLLYFLLKNFYKERLIFTLFLGNISLLIIFKYFILLGALRHDGFSYISVISFIFLSNSKERIFKSNIITFLLSIHFLIVPVSLYNDYKYNFSNIHLLASFLNSYKNIQNKKIFIGFDINGVGINAYLLNQKYEPFLFPGNRSLRFVKWDQDRLTKTMDPNNIDNFDLLIFPGNPHLKFNLRNFKRIYYINTKTIIEWEREYSVYEKK